MLQGPVRANSPVIMQVPAGAPEQAQHQERIHGKVVK